MILHLPVLQAVIRIVAYNTNASQDYGTFFFNFHENCSFMQIYKQSIFNILISIFTQVISIISFIFQLTLHDKNITVEFPTGGRIFYFFIFSKSRKSCRRQEILLFKKIKSGKSYRRAGRKSYCNIFTVYHGTVNCTKALPFYKHIYLCHTAFFFFSVFNFRQ